jgi:hypothetical protein
MKYILIILLMFLVSIAVSSQTDRLAKFLPRGYTFLDSAKGDLNQDGLNDVLLILKSTVESNDTATLRPLLILHGQRDGSLKLVERNDNIVLCYSCGGVFGDPYSGIAIKNNYFSIEHFGGSSTRWTRIITFKYNMKTKEYLLHKDAGVSYDVSDPGKTEPQSYNEEGWNKMKFKDYSGGY